MVTSIPVKRGLSPRDADALREMLWLALIEVHDKFQCPPIETSD